jgi:hypothetical protein
VGGAAPGSAGSSASGASGAAGGPSALCATQPAVTTLPDQNKVVTAPGGANYVAVWGSSTTDVWAAIDDGTITHYDGANWGAPAKVFGASDDQVVDIWGASATDVWVLGYSHAVRNQGSGWVDQNLPTSFGQLDYTIHGAGGQVWVGGAQGVALEWDGSKWNDHTIPAVTGQVNQIQVVAADDVWAVVLDPPGSGLFHYSGGSWAPINTNGLLVSVGLYVSTPNDLWLAGTFPYHYDGTCWQIAAGFDPTDTLNQAGRMFGLSASNVWSVLESEKIAHYDGQAWSVQASFPTGVSEAWSVGTTTWVVGPNGLRQTL